MDDGTEFIAGPGDVTSLLSGHEDTSELREMIRSGLEDASPAMA
jgi:hypothetical protein